MLRHPLFTSVRVLGYVLGHALCAALPGAPAAQAEPLRLDAVLALADAPHPGLRQAIAEVDIAQAEVALADSLRDFRITLEAALRGGRNAVARSDFEPDHQISLNLRKTLWDGGWNAAQADAARLTAASREALLVDARARRRQELMARYFDVLLADLQYTADDEMMAVAYVAWDNARERQQLGELSAPALAELEARFQDLRVRRNGSLRQAREKRARLANAMNTPGEMAAELEDPVLNGNDRALPDFDTLWHTLQRHNSRLAAQRLALDAAGRRIEALRGDTTASLAFEAGAAAYSRDTLTRDTLSSGLHLVWPLGGTAERAAQRARQQAEGERLRAEQDALILELRQALYEVHEEILHLRDSERGAAATHAGYRDWALERARAEYEMEMKTNLGYSMAETQVARLRQRAVEYRLALAWERLQALLGAPLDASAKETGK